MRPVDDTAPLIPLILAVELDAISSLQSSDAARQIDVVCHEYSLPGGQANDESLMPAPTIVVGQDSRDVAAALDLSVAAAILECSCQYLVGTARTRGRANVILTRNEPAFDDEICGRECKAN